MGRLGMRMVRGLDSTSNFLVHYGGLLFCVFMTILLYYVCIFIALPTRPDYDPVFWTNLANFLAIEVWMNLLCFIYFTKYNSVSHWQRQSCVADICRRAGDNDVVKQIDTATGVILSVDSEGNQVESGKYCLQCQREAPLRSHHCPLCDMCVLRKDHHCFITGGCVGIGNQRFFMTFVFWVAVTLTLFVRYYGEYALDQDSTLLPWGWIRLFGPLSIIRWVLGMATFGQAVTGTLLSFGIAASIGCCGFFILQIYYTLYGYTMYEYHSSLMREAFDGDGDTAGERLRLVFGRWWLLNFIFPVVWEMPVLTPKIANNLFHIRSSHIPKILWSHLYQVDLPPTAKAD